LTTSICRHARSTSPDSGSPPCADTVNRGRVGSSDSTRSAVKSSVTRSPLTSTSAAPASGTASPPQRSTVPRRPPSSSRAADPPAASSCAHIHVDTSGVGATA
jgi:hypothetical protein